MVNKGDIFAIINNYPQELNGSMYDKAVLHSVGDTADAVRSHIYAVLSEKQKAELSASGEDGQAKSCNCYMCEHFASYYVKKLSNNENIK